jgi:hypothetical protein
MPAAGPRTTGVLEGDTGSVGRRRVRRRRAGGVEADRQEWLRNPRPGCRQLGHARTLRPLCLSRKSSPRLSRHRSRRCSTRGDDARFLANSLLPGMVRCLRIASMFLNIECSSCGFSGGIPSRPDGKPPRCPRCRSEFVRVEESLSAEELPAPLPMTETETLPEKPPSPPKWLTRKLFLFVLGAVVVAFVLIGVLVRWVATAPSPEKTRALFGKNVAALPNAPQWQDINWNICSPARSGGDVHLDVEVTYVRISNSYLFNCQKIGSPEGHNSVFVFIYKGLPPKKERLNRENAQFAISDEGEARECERRDVTDEEWSLLRSLAIDIGLALHRSQ